MSTNSIRFIDPSWDLVDLGEPLCPSLFYASGICSYDKNEAQVESEEADIDEPKDENKDEISVGDKIINFWASFYN